MSDRKSRGHYGSRYRRLRSEKLAGVPPCYLCGELIDTTLPWRHPGAPQIHMIVPVTKGGSWHDPNNCVPAHRLCNIKQSNHDDGTISHRLNQRTEAWVVGETP